MKSNTSRLSATVLGALLLLTTAATAQIRNSEHTLRLDKSAKRVPASLDDISWLVGRWQGTGLGGEMEEIWSPAHAGAMMGVFRSVKEGKPVFYEMMLLMRDEESLVLKIKHFTPEMTGWEEKDKSVDFKLIKIEGETAYFNGLTFAKSGPDRLDIYLVLRYGPDDRREEHMRLTRLDNY